MKRDQKDERDSRDLKGQAGNCGGHCTHTDAEHAAFDLGVDWGRAQGLDAGNPFASAAEREAFEHGKSVGVKAHLNEWPPVKTGMIDLIDSGEGQE